MLPRFIVSLIILAFSFNKLSRPGAHHASPPRAPSRAAASIRKRMRPARRFNPSRPALSAAPALPPALPVSAIKIRAAIDGQIATVKVEHLFRNESDDVLEGTYYYPVPEGAILLEFAVYDGDERRVGRVKEKQEARAAYAEAAAQGEDPAILEVTKSGWFQSRVYPICPPVRKTRRDHLLADTPAER